MFRRYLRGDAHFCSFIDEGDKFDEVAPEVSTSEMKLDTEEYNEAFDNSDTSEDEDDDDPLSILVFFDDTIKYKFQCTICDVDLPSEVHIDRHFQSKAHLNKLQTPVKRDKRKKIDMDNTEENRDKGVIITKGKRQFLLSYKGSILDSAGFISCPMLKCRYEVDLPMAVKKCSEELLKYHSDAGGS